MINLIKKNKHICLYVIFGLLTTIINIISYYLFAHIIHFTITISNILAWILAVLFAYITNRKWVFHSQNIQKRSIIKEIVYFLSCRLFTGFTDLLIMYIFANKLQLNDLIIKVVANIIVIVLNYIFSKLVIFKNKDKMPKKNLP